MVRIRKNVLFLLEGIPIETLDASKVSINQIDFIKLGLAAQFGSEADEIDIKYVTIVEKVNEYQNAIYLLKAMVLSRLNYNFNLN